MNINDIKLGHTYSNGRSNRIVVGIEPPFVLYKSKRNSRNTTGIMMDKFVKWATHGRVVTWI